MTAKMTQAQIKTACEVGKEKSMEYGDACLYQFCMGCEYKESVFRDGKVIRVRCPARFNPFESTTDERGEPRKDGRGCPKHDRFMKMEIMKNRNRSDYVGEREPS